MRLTSEEAQELERMAVHWRTVIGNVGDGKMRGFALSIYRQLMKGYWRPSAKQWRVMQSLYAEHGPTHVDDGPHPFIDFDDEADSENWPWYWCTLEQRTMRRNAVTPLLI